MKSWLINHFNLLLVSLIAIFSPVIPLLLTVYFLVATDFILAIYRAWKKDPNSITSRKMSNTVGKLLIYTLTLLCLFLLETYVLGPILPFTKIVAGLISLVELKSIDETFKALLGYSFYSKLVNMVKRGTSNTKDLIE